MNTRTRASIALVTVLALAPPAAAQEAPPSEPAGPSSSVMAVARTEFDAGVRDARAQHWPDALRHFRRAYEITRSPQVLLNVAGALVQTGKLVEGAETYRRLLREAPESLTELRTAAHDALAAVETRAPRATVRVSGLAVADELFVDDDALPRAALETPVPLDPGAHTFRVVRAHAEVARHRVTLREGEGVTVQLTIAPEAEHGFVGSVPFWGLTAGVLVFGAIAGFGLYFASAPNTYCGNVAPCRVSYP